MDKTTWLGVVLGIIAVVLGMILKGVGFDVLINPAAVLIIIIGTAASVITAFPTSEIKRVPKIVGILFKEKNIMDSEELIRQFSDWAQLARKEGLLSLEARISEVEDPFLKNGLLLAVDGQSADYIRDVLNEEIDAMEERHLSGAQIFTQAGTYAPSLGVLGAVIGLIAALGNMSDMDVLGEAISAAFVATMLGIFTGYILWHPFANKLKRKSKIEAKQKRIMIEGILSILEGESPRVIEQKLSSYLPGIQRTVFLNESSVTMDE
ncbi:flagellar motor stator protein MotA [Bacillus sp. CRN 9]|uniref:flagellar motor stator protein MotA n=1 Tax=Cytobacillus horneckiae TaxID=549687 RepID=UPI0015626797|nr:flagellar motor stator protein MotA [Bacillus sp. CRN 9]